MTIVQPSDIIPLGVGLFAKGIISSNIKVVIDNRALGKHERVSILVDAIISNLKCYPKNFEEVLSVLKDDYKDLVDRIERTYRENGEYTTV